MQMKASGTHISTSESKEHPEGLSKPLAGCCEDSSSTSGSEHAVGIALAGWLGTECTSQEVTVLCGNNSTSTSAGPWQPNVGSRGKNCGKAIT